MPEVVPTKRYDWTYTTTYSGHEGPPSAPPPDTISLSRTNSRSSTSSDLDSSEPSAQVEAVEAVGEPVKATWVAADPEDPTQAIPIAELTRPDPILFYAEIPLFEDELHDNGSSILLVRIVRLIPMFYP